MDAPMNGRAQAFENPESNAADEANDQKRTSFSFEQRTLDYVANRKRGLKVPAASNAAQSCVTGDLQGKLRELPLSHTVRRNRIGRCILSYESQGLRIKDVPTNFMEPRCQLV
jgi:hypothetical protein